MSAAYLALISFLMPPDEENIIHDIETPVLRCCVDAVLPGEVSHCVVH